MKRTSKFLPITFLITSIAILFVIKISVLNLPHFWDEAFPYSYAIGHMSENGSSLLSDGAPTVYTTGHPLLYYFLQSNWNNLVGGVLWMERLFPIILSTLILVFTFLVGKHLHSNWTGGIAAILLSTQSSFLSQASFQLPETMLTLFLLMSIYYSITNKKWAFVLVATGLVFTKETGVILLFILFMNFVVASYNKSNLTTFLKSTWVYIIPIALNFLFYLHQYYVQGWFLFPRHTGFILFDADLVFNQFSRFFAHLFIYDGRNITFFTMLIFIAFFGMAKWKRSKKIASDQTVFLLISLIVGFLIFSAFNFYSNRYILCLFPIFVILASLSITTLFKEKFWISSAIGLVLAIVTLTQGLTKSSSSDCSLGYSDVVRTQMSAINYCVNMGWQNKSIETGFLMSKNLTSHYPRYVKQDQIFFAVNETNSTPEVIIVSSIEPKTGLLENLDDFYSVQRFESKNEWCEILAKNHKDN
jgi:4-amino-4-deoxy-L-arabinose transferase-like glycosyltransferase